jgi:hypothetical protein
MNKHTLHTHFNERYCSNDIIIKLQHQRCIDVLRCAYNNMTKLLQNFTKSRTTALPHTFVRTAAILSLTAFALRHP